MDTIATEWQVEPNSCWFTTETLRCEVCNKKRDRVIEMKYGPTIRVCLDCMQTTLFRLWEDHEYVLCRSIETHNSGRVKKREPIGLSLRYEVMKRDNFRCVRCGKNASDTTIEIDHILPVASGGKSTKINLHTLCFDCNRGKRDG